jgi:hypothetical protein
VKGTTVDTAPAYRPELSVDKVQRTEFWALMEVVSGAARELAEFVYVAWQTEDDAERAAALQDAALLGDGRDLPSAAGRARRSRRAVTTTPGRARDWSLPPETYWRPSATPARPTTSNPT